MFGFLKAAPLFPLVFDSLLKLWMFASKPHLLDWLGEIETEEVLSWDGKLEHLLLLLYCY